MVANNTKTLREALEKLCAEIVRFYSNEWIPYDAWQCCDEIISNALSTPPCNCDVGTAADQIVRFDTECHAIRSRNTVEPCAYCPFSENGEGTEDCQLRWAQVPYEKDANKGGSE